MHRLPAFPKNITHCYPPSPVRLYKISGLTRPFSFLAPSPLIIFAVNDGFFYSLISSVESFCASDPAVCLACFPVSLCFLPCLVHFAHHSQHCCPRYWRSCHSSSALCASGSIFPSVAACFSPMPFKTSPSSRFVSFFYPPLSSPGTYQPVLPL